MHILICILYVFGANSTQTSPTPATTEIGLNQQKDLCC